MTIFGNKSIFQAHNNFTYFVTRIINHTLPYMKGVAKLQTTQWTDLVLTAVLDAGVPPDTGFLTRLAGAVALAGGILEDGPDPPALPAIATPVPKAWPSLAATGS
jgi:hypothetical protein